jgi:hypothetical protein
MKARWLRAEVIRRAADRLRPEAGLSRAVPEAGPTQRARAVCVSGQGHLEYMNTPPP